MSLQFDADVREGAGALVVGVEHGLCTSGGTGRRWGGRRAEPAGSPRTTGTPCQWGFMVPSGGDRSRSRPSPSVAKLKPSTLPGGAGEPGIVILLSRFGGWVMVGRLLRVTGTTLVIAVAFVTPVLVTATAAPAAADTVVDGCTIVSNPTSTNFTNCPGADLAGADLHSFNLSFAKFDGADLAGALLAACPPPVSAPPVASRSF